MINKYKIILLMIFMLKTGYHFNKIRNSMINMILVSMDDYINDKN
jgi:hypothetical protein